MKQKVTMELDERKRVFICSPLRPREGTPKEQQMELFLNMELASLACRYAVQHGCNPMAPHLLIPAFLDDTNPEERQIGIELGMDWLMDCNELWVIGDRISEGMQEEIDTALDLDIPVIRIGFVGDPIKTLEGIVFDEYDDEDADEDDEYEDDEYDDEEEGLIYDGD